MKQCLVRLAMVALLISVAGFASGCRTRKLKGDRLGLPPVGQVPRAGGRGDFDLAMGTDLGTGDWAGTGAPLDAGMGADGLAANERRWEGVAVYFGYDRATVGISEQPKVEALARHLQANPQYYVIVEGHCDDRGSDEYNRALGERRALAVRDFLVSLGIGANRIRTISYGEEKPAVANAVSEDQHALNRRAEFVLGLGL